MGTSRTPATNSRIVRPLEMRAMKTPTKGAQEIHQPQENVVHAACHA